MLDQLQNELLGAMIGLVRAGDKNSKTPDTDRLLLEGLIAVRDDTVSEEQISRIREEKVKAAPGCARCAMPCGSTADAEMEIIWKSGDEIAATKKELLRILCGAADGIFRQLNHGSADDQTLFLLHKGLFFIGEYVGGEELRNVIQELKPLEK